MNQPIFEWNKETGTATCILTNGEYFYMGTANCHPDDEDMMSENTGYEIAFRRARIDALRGYKKELKTKLSALNQLYYSMNQSTRFNKKSYENIMLQRQIRLITFDLTTIKEIIADEYKSLKDYITEKDKFYKVIRANRASGKNN